MHRILFLDLDVDHGRRRRGLVERLARLAVALPVAVAAGAAVTRAADIGPPGAQRPARGNFVVHGASGARGLAIVEHAEAVRLEISRRLLGDAAPAPWREPCHVHVHASARSFAATLGGPPATARGATSLEFAADRVTLRRIDVMGDGPDAVPDALAHEIVHVVLGDRFTAAAPPRWADEGLALLFDPPDAQRRHDADFRAALRLGCAWTAADLLAIEEYPPQAARQRVFYGQSAALVRWLVARRDAPAFVAFAADCGEIGTAAALERHYGIASIADLDAAWSETSADAPRVTTIPVAATPDRP